jgi:putative addiction module antidote
MTTLKLTQIGNSVGVILPKELLAQLGVDKGDTLFVTKTVDGVEIRKSDDQFERHMAAAREVMRENYDALKKLAE